jgi:dynein intermediate chain 2, axonemal
MEIYHQYIRLRKQFGRWPKFVDEGAEMLADIRPNEDHAAQYIDRNPVLTVVQCVPEMSEHEANTNAVILASKAMSHLEGGWPKDVDYTEAEHVIRYRKKVEKDEDYIKTVTALGSSVEELVKQNNAIDIYQEYYTGIGTDHSAEVPHANTATVFKDPNDVKRSASYLHWHPDGTKVVVAYSIMAFQKQPSGMPLSSYIWDINNPNTPEYELLPPSQLCCVKFNHKDTNIIGAGQYNGQVTYFDVRKGSAPVDASPVDVSHRDPVYDFAWLQSKTGSECMSVSTDGMVYWWDTRKLSEPLENLPLKEKGSDTVLGICTLEYDPAAGPTKFMVGTEQGTILSCNRKAKNPADRVGAAYPGHHGPVYGLRRNPFYPKYFMSVADWTARIWNEDLKTPLMTTKYHSSYITGGTWSPTRPGVFFTTKMDGTLDVWDLFYKHTDPTLQVGNSAGLVGSRPAFVLYSQLLALWHKFVHVFCELQCRC